MHLLINLPQEVHGNDDEDNKGAADAYHGKHPHVDILWRNQNKYVERISMTPNSKNISSTTESKNQTGLS